MPEWLVEWMPALSALAGAVIGVIGGWGGHIIAARSQSRRELRQAAYENARLEWQTADKLAKERAKKTGRTTVVSPLPAYVAFHMALAESIERGATPRDIERALAKAREIDRVFYAEAGLRRVDDTDA